MNLIPVVLAVLAALNLLSFSLMAADKRRARAGRWRISEKTLFMAMTLCHHKTRHWYFRVFFPLLLIAQIVLLILGWRMLF